MLKCVSLWIYWTRATGLCWDHLSDTGSQSDSLHSMEEWEGVSQMRYRKWVPQQLGDVADMQGVVEFCEIFVTNHYKDLQQFVSNPPDKSNQLCLCKYNKECRVESVIYSAIWFRSNLFYSAFFGRISVNFFGMPVPDIPCPRHTAGCLGGFQLEWLRTCLMRNSCFIFLKK